MSDIEFDDLFLQLKNSYQKHRQLPSNDCYLHDLLKRIDVFINRRQMKLQNHQKRLDDLQQDLLLSESERSKNRAALERKDFEVHQLHELLSRAEQTTQVMMKKYDDEVEKLTGQLCHVQYEYERLKSTQKRQSQTKSTNDLLNEIYRLQQENRNLQLENQRLNTDKDSPRNTTSDFTLKLKSLEAENVRYKQQIHQSEAEIRQLEKVRSALSQSEQQCQLLRLELQRMHAEKEILKVHLLEQKLSESNTVENKDVDPSGYENFIRNELQINIEKANLLISFWKDQKKNFEDKIRRLTDELERLKRETKLTNLNDHSIQISHLNETILHAKRDVNQLQIELSDKNTTIYNLYKKIECLEQALTISKQRMNSQAKEIQELREKYKDHVGFNEAIHAEFRPFDELMTDDDDRARSSLNLKTNLRTSSPIQSSNLHRYGYHYNGDSTPSMNIDHC